MTYNTVAIMARDAGLLGRITAASAVEQAGDPRWWVEKYCWNVVSAPGWSAKWESAVAANLADPGRSEVVITDGDILSAVQAIVAQFGGV